MSFVGATATAQDLNPADWNNLVGYWKFQDVSDLTKATVGNNLTLVGSHSVVAGAMYGDTATRIAIGSYYDYAHGIAANGGGDSVNQYTLMFDFKVLSLNKWHTFFQTDTSNANDGECFIRPNTTTRPGRIGTATTRYTEDSIFPNQWYRLVISVNLDHYYRYYLNGKLVLDGDTQYVDDRFALTPRILFFADNNQEDDTIDIASMAIFDTCLSSNDVAKIGTVEPCIAYPPKFDLGKDTTLCSYETLNLGAGLGYTKYQWSFGSSTPFVLLKSSTLGLGSTPVWLQVTDKNGCVGRDTIVINYVATPTINLGADTSICDGQHVEITGGTDTTLNFRWTEVKTGQVVSTKNSVTIDSTGLYALMATSSDGCYASDTIKVLVNKNPDKPKITVAGLTNFCLGDSVKLSGPSDYQIYLWSNRPDGATIYGTSSQLVWLQVGDTNACISAPSDSLEIVVYELPTTPELLAMGDTAFCLGDSTNLMAPIGYAEYKWNDGTGERSRIVKDAGGYSVAVVDSNACTSLFSNTVNISTFSVPDKPTISVTGNLTLCRGDSVRLNADGNFAEFLWQDANISKARNISKAGDYQVKVYNANGCGSDWSDTVHVRIIDYPAKPKIVIGNNDSLVCNVSADFYRWYSNGVLMPDTNKMIFAPRSAFYSVMAGNGVCWSEISDSLYYQNSNIGKIVDALPIARMVPNPVIGEAKLWLDIGTSSQMISVTISNSLGQTVMALQQIWRPVDDFVPLDVQALAPGIYFVRVHVSGQNFTTKFEKL